MPDTKLNVLKKKSQDSVQAYLQFIWVSLLEKKSQTWSYKNMYVTWSIKKKYVIYLQSRFQYLGRVSGVVASPSKPKTKTPLRMYDKTFL